MAAITRREYSGNAGATTLSSSISNSDTSIAVDDGSGFPTGTNPFFIVIGRGTSAEEKVLCSGRSGNTITASSRGADDTSAASHDAGEAVEHVWTAQDADDVNKVAAALTTKGDLLGFGTEPTRVPIGADGKFLVADSADAEGVVWGGDHGNLAGLADDDHTQYAKLAGDTFTGAVTFQALLTAQAGVQANLGSDVHAVTDGPSAWPDGLTWQLVTSGSWPTTNGAVFNFNLPGTAARDVQIFVDASSGGSMYFRTGSTSTTWTDWRTLTSAENPGVWEVDGSTEVASATLGTTFADEASVALSIPSDWGSWKCEAYATCATDATNVYSFRIVIDGTAQQTLEGIDVSADKPVSVGGHRTGMTTTGSRTVAFQAKAESGTPNLADIYLYARAVRTG